VTEPEKEEGRTRWHRRTVTMSRSSLVVLVLGAGAIVAIVGLAIAAIPMALFGYEGLQAVLAVGVILAAAAVTRLLLDLRRHLRVRARHRRLSASRDDEDEDA
jgi:hypothetical protein